VWIQNWCAQETREEVSSGNLFFMMHDSSVFLRTYFYGTTIYILVSEELCTTHVGKNEKIVSANCALESTVVSVASM
jgi:hypothetical protein